MEIRRSNINRGYTRLNVWNNALELFKIVYCFLNKSPFELQRTSSNIIDAANSIIRNIAEGYCRRNIKEYLNFLYIALGSTGELLSGMIALKEIKFISEENFEIFDKLHYQTENQLLGLIKSLQNKARDGSWQNSFTEL